MTTVAIRTIYSFFVETKNGKPNFFIAAERQRGSTLFLTLHEVLAFSCPVPGRVIFSQYLDFCGGDVSKSEGNLSIQVGF